MASGADIQIELGNWAKVHNLILKALAKADLTGREAKCLFFLLSMTYGKQDKEHEISLSLWADETGISKRHVKPIIDRLIERRIMYCVPGKQGRGNTSIYGFNKYFEQWDTTEKVPSTVPIEKVPSAVPIREEKVPSTVPEKVPSTVPNKEREKQQSRGLPATDDEDGTNAIALIRLAYQTVAKIAPSPHRDDGKANLITAMELIETYGYTTCIREISTLKERNDTMIRRNVRNSIRSPVGYLKTLLEENSFVATNGHPAPSVLDFAIEDMS